MNKSLDYIMFWLYTVKSHKQKVKDTFPSRRGIYSFLKCSINLNHRKQPLKGNDFLLADICSTISEATGQKQIPDGFPSIMKKWLFKVGPFQSSNKAQQGKKKPTIYNTYPRRLPVESQKFREEPALFVQTSSGSSPCGFLL